ncbi:MAG TPA: AsmA family protein [Candidatus Sumerlaeota bacterium]|nr:AsmA family protein [Candidatus Sumerlaeota bacterium]
MSDTKVAALPKPKSKLWRWTKRIVLVLAVVLVVAIGVIRIMLPGIIKDQVEANGSKYLKTDVTVGSVSLSLLRGAASINDLKIKNYEGFQEANALEIKQLGANVAIGSLMTDTIVVDKISVDGLQLNAEINTAGKQNLQVMMDNLNSELNPPKKEKPKEEKKKSSGKKKKEESKSKGLLLREFAVTKLAVNFNDQYSRDERMTSSTSIGKFTVENVGLPATGARAGSRIMKANLRDYTITGNDGFTKRTFVSVPETSMDLDLGKLLDSKNDMYVHIPRIEHEGLDLVMEDTESKPNDTPMPENFRQFIQVVMNTLPGNEPRRYEVASNEEDSKDWYAELTREPKDTEEKKSSKKSSKPKDNGKADEVEEKAPAESDSAGEEEESPKLTTLVIDDISLQKMRLELIRPKEKNAKRIVLDDVNVKLTKLTQPYQEGTESELVLTMVPQQTPSLVKLNAKGGLTDPRPERKIVADLQVTEFPMGTVPRFEDGIVNAATVMTMKEKVASGTLTFSAKQLKVGTFDPPYDKLKPMISLISFLQLPEIKVPYSVKMKENQKWSKIFQRLLDSIVKQLPASVNSSIETAGKALDEAGKSAMKAASAASEQIGAAADLASESLDAAGAAASATVKEGAKVIGDTAETGKQAVEDVTSGVKDTGKSITSGVKGLFGGKDKKAEEEEKKPKE